MTGSDEPQIFYRVGLTPDDVVDFSIYDGKVVSAEVFEFDDNKFKVYLDLDLGGVKGNFGADYTLRGNAVKDLFTKTNSESFDDLSSKLSGMAVKAYLGNPIVKGLIFYNG